MMKKIANKRVEIITFCHQTFEDQLACLSDQNMFASDIKDWSKDIGRCISHCLYMSPTVFMYPIKTLYLIARRYYMVPTQGGRGGPTCSREP